jgi:Zn-dependent protease
VRYDEFGSALVGLAGPVTNFVLAIAGALLLRGVGSYMTGLLSNFFFIFVEVNIGLFVFNMIPLPPLDGSRLLYAFAPDWLRKVMLQIETLGIFPILFLLFLLLPVISPVLNSVNSGLLSLLLG